MDTNSDQQDHGPEDDLVHTDPDLGTDSEADTGHPSQAEGEDPDDDADAHVLPQEGHPSPAEG
ncbi:hypothetical protein ACOKGD_13480 [Microbacterium phosphatis]|uniref:hypothetical protein n=1 Tax=Microbacterium phosphatis TaxID=3140248 RepID=UPI0031406125